MHPFILVCSIMGNRLGLEGVKHVADMLAVNQTLTSVEYATPHSHTHVTHVRPT